MNITIISPREARARELADMAEDWREMRWVIDELKRIARDEPEFYKKHHLADFAGGDLEWLERTWQQFQCSVARVVIDAIRQTGGA
jgi:hypothetical protein